MMVRTGPRGVVLIGFMGAGKSSVGKELARRLGAEFVDIDGRIEARSGKSIQEIFSTEGEPAFREMEREAIRDTLSVPGRVVATGGGAFLDRENRKRLKAYSPVVFLEVSPGSVLARLGEDRSRPLLSGVDRERAVRELLERRRPIYEEADIRVDTENLTAKKVADRVVALLALIPGRSAPGKSTGRKRGRA